MKYEIVVGAVSNRDSAWSVCKNSPSFAVGDRSYERIAIVEQVMSFYGIAMVGRCLLSGFFADPELFADIGQNLRPVLREDTTIGQKANARIAKVVNAQTPNEV